MDYDSPLFIAAVKKILREGMADLTNSLNDFKDAVNTHWQADEKRSQTKPVTVTDLRSDVPIRVQTEPKRSQPEKVWRYIIGALEAAAFLAIILYTIVTYQQWQETIDATNLSARQIELSRKGLNETTKYFRIEHRALMKITAEPGQSLDIIPPAFWTARFTNIGKTPAFQIEAEFQFQFLEKGDSPVFDCETRPCSTANSPLMWPEDKDAIPVIRAYYAGTHTRKDTGINARELALFKQGGAWIAKNGRLAYVDIFGVKHLTTFCAYSLVTMLDVRERRNFPGIHACVAYNSVDTN